MWCATLVVAAAMELVEGAMPCHIDREGAVVAVECCAVPELVNNVEVNVVVSWM